MITICKLPLLLFVGSAEYIFNRSKERLIMSILKMVGRGQVKVLMCKKKGWKLPYLWMKESEIFSPYLLEVIIILI